jgi:hypothetical protein
VRQKGSYLAHVVLLQFWKKALEVSMKKILLTNLLLALLLLACTPPTASPTDIPADDTPPPAELPPPTEVPTTEPTAQPTPTSEPMARPPTTASIERYPELDEEDQTAYESWDLDSSLLDSFWADWKTAVAEDAAWLQDPYEVAQQLVDNTRRFSDEPIPLEESFYLPADSGEAIFIIILGEFRDDSVWGNKLRIELTEQEGLWEIDWVGEQWRCRRGGAELEENWHTTLCP